MELIPNMTVAQAVDEFKDCCGGLLKIKANPGDSLKSLGLKSAVRLEASITVAALESAAAAAGLKLKVRTIDDWVAVIPEFPIGFISKIGKNSTKTKMAALLATLDIESLTASSVSQSSPADVKAKVKREEKVPKNAVTTPSPAPAKNLKTTPQNKELITEEEMSEILKKLEALEARIANLEKQLASGATQAASNGGDKLSVVKWLPYVGVYAYDPNSFYSYFTDYVAKLSNGKRYRMNEIRTDEQNFTVGQTRKVADRFGYKYNSKTNREDLGWELVTKYGDDKYAFIGNKAVDAQGRTYNLFEMDFLYSKEAVRLATGEAVDHEGKPILHHNYVNTPLKLDPKWTEE